MPRPERAIGLATFQFWVRYGIARLRSKGAAIIAKAD
jgi:hypothetical protein